MVKENKDASKGFDTGNSDGTGLLELEVYDPSDPRSLEEVVSKEIGLSVELLSEEEEVDSELLEAWLEK